MGEGQQNKGRGKKPIANTDQLSLDLKIFLSQLGARYLSVQVVCIQFSINSRYMWTSGALISFKFQEECVNSNYRNRRKTLRDKLKWRTNNCPEAPLLLSKFRARASYAVCVQDRANSTRRSCSSEYLTRGRIYLLEEQVSLSHHPAPFPALTNSTPPSCSPSQSHDSSHLRRSTDPQRTSSRLK